MARWKMIDQSLNLGLPEPLETYSSSDHFFEAMKIPQGVTGTADGKPKKVSAPTTSRDERRPEKRDSAPRKTEARKSEAKNSEPKKSEPSSRVRTRTKKFK
jgi:hypothetical protein